MSTPTPSTRPLGFLQPWDPFVRHFHSSSRRGKADVVIQSSVDEAGDLKFYGEFPETVRGNWIVVPG